MLILSRKQGQSLHINDNIKITILECKGKTVKLGFEIPAGVIVLREEVYERIKEENRQARLNNPKDFYQVVALWPKQEQKK